MSPFKKGFFMKKLILLSLAVFFSFKSFALEEVSQETFLNAESSLNGYLVKTPLIPLPQLSKKSGKKVFLKDESMQKGRSFKIRGVSYEVFKTIEDLIVNHDEVLNRGLQLVTQTDGNHGVALILAVTSAIEKFSQQYPEMKDAICRIEPVIFTYKKVLPIKRQTMNEALQEYRKVAGNEAQGLIDDVYEDYGTARVGREAFIAQQEGRAIYMEHGGPKTMVGHGLASLEILDQLSEVGIDDQEKVCLMLPIGAGGPIGLAAVLKTFRPNSTAVMVQTPRWGAFIRSMESGKLEYNDSSLSPYTVEVIENGTVKPVIYEDGISVDGPESFEALEMAYKYLDDGLYSDPKRALQEVAPLILSDLDRYYLNPNKSVVGGTTAIVGDALLSNLFSKTINEADVIVLFGTEGSIDPAIASYTRTLLENNPS